MSIFTKIKEGIQGLIPSRTIEITPTPTQPKSVREDLAQQFFAPKTYLTQPPAPKPPASKPTTPTLASQISPGQSTATDLTSGNQQIQTTTAAGGVEGTSSIDAMLAGYQEQFKQATEAMKQSAEAVAGEKGFSAQEYLDKQMKESGIMETMAQTNKLIAETQAIRENVAKMEDQKNQEILSMRQTGGVSQTTLSGRETIAEMKWNSRISAESAKLSGYAATIDALNGNITRAQTFITQAVNAATYDQEQNLNRLKFVYDANKDLFSTLGSQYQNAFNKAIDIKQQELKDIKDEKQEIGKLMIQYPTAGINMGMTFEEALNAAQPYETQKQNLERRAQEALIASREKTPTVTPKSQLNAEQLSIINDAEATLDYAKQSYQDTVTLRAQIIERAKQQYGFDLSPYI